MLHTVCKLRFLVCTGGQAYSLPDVILLIFCTYYCLYLLSYLYPLKVQACCPGYTLHLPNGPLKNSSGLKPVPRCEPNPYQPIGQWLPLHYEGWLRTTLANDFMAALLNMTAFLFSPVMLLMTWIFFISTVMVFIFAFFYPIYILIFNLVFGIPNNCGYSEWIIQYLFE